MKKFTTRFLEKYANDLIYQIANKLDDIEQEKVDQKLFKERVSYLPVFKSIKGEHIGTLSRKKYFFSKLKGKPFNPIEINDKKIDVVDIHENLDDVLKKLENSSGLILKIDGEYKKFISPRTVSDAFKNYTSKILFIEMVEIKIRENIKTSNINFIQSLKKKNQHIKNSKGDLKHINDLTFSDYNLIYSDKWEEFNFRENIVSKSDFLTNLSLISQIRNDLFHFRNKLDYDKKPFQEIINWLNN